jgi:hypothetical protein
MMNFDVCEPVAMHTMKPQRGRPKGSGIDDRARLQQIAGMMAVDPRLKPTTAIKAIGITDPSTIRRLRDKLRSMGDGLHPGQSESQNPTGIPGQSRMDSPYMESGSGGYRSLAAQRLQEQIRRFEPTPPPPRLSPFEPAAQPARAEADDTVAAMAHMMAMGLVNMMNLMQHQDGLWRDMMSNPAIALSLRQQLILSEMLLDATPNRRAPRTTAFAAALTG